MIRAGAAAAAALSLLVQGAAAQVYVVTHDPAPVGEAPSAVASRAIPQSTLAPRAAASTAAPLDLGSTLGLAKGGDAAALSRAESALTELGATTQDGRIHVSLPGDVLFDFDKSDIRPDARAVLERLAEALAALPDVPVAIVGHTDAKGADDYNQALSERRAQSVRSWLAQRDIPASRLSASGKGEAQPVAPNTRPDGQDDPAGRQRNRRVEFIIGG